MNPIDNEKYSIILPGRVTAFDELTQTATVQISVQRLFSNSESRNQDAGKREPITGVPVHVLQAGGWSLTIPVAAGDTCVLLFSQVGYDHWMFEDKDRADPVAKLPAPHLWRQFDEDDGFCIVGFNPIPRAIQSYAVDGMELRNADKSVSIKLGNNGDITLTPTGKVFVAGDLDVSGLFTNPGNDLHVHNYVDAPPGITLGPVAPA